MQDLVVENSSLLGILRLSYPILYRLFDLGPGLVHVVIRGLLGLAG